MSLRELGLTSIPRRGLAAALCALPALAASAVEGGMADATAIRPGERLSDWLLRQPASSATSASPGLAWHLPQEQVPQRYLRHTLIEHLESAIRAAPADQKRVFQQLLGWVQSLPVTGRVALGVVDARWLQANPGEDPVLAPGQQLVAPPTAPRTVAVVQPDGVLCHVPHQAGRGARDYLRACGRHTQDSQATEADWAWIAQPDGRTERAAVAAWNAAPADEPAPGAWIWAAPRDMPDLVALSEGLATFLATQGPSPPPNADSASTHTAVASLPAAIEPKPRALPISSNDWGEAGLLQTPSARMAAAGSMRASYSTVWPYTRINFMFQPLDWLEGGFRYTSIANVPYAVSTTGQSTKDKSIDLKLRLLKESATLPQVALGFRDIGGTGLFSAEYLVASKRWHDLDFSLGVGWGYMGSSGNIGNPFRLLSNRFDTRPPSDGRSTSLGQLFRGPAALFGGVQWHTPWDPLTLKLEYDGNDFSDEPFGNALRRRSPINVGLSYRVSPKVTLSAGFERGDRFMLGLSLSGQPAQAASPKIFDAPAPAFSPAPPAQPPADADLAAGIEAQTGWGVSRIAMQGEALHLWVSGSGATYRSARVDRAIAVLHQGAPAAAQKFVLRYEERGIPLHAQVIDRAAWVAARNQAQPPHEARQNATQDYAPAVRAAAPSTPSPASLPNVRDGDGSDWHAPRSPFSFSVAPSFGQIVGGPDSFILYQVGVQAGAEYRFTPNTWLSGTAHLRLVDNYDKFSYTAPSDLPRVRTFMREYATTRRLTLPNLQLTHVGEAAPGHYYSVYGGLLESMFAGVGAEWLYRPWRSRVAFGVDVNHVRQRDFAQDLRLRDYRVNTGHASVYWDTGWHGVMLRVSAGQYLAGDRGATLDVVRRFDNGFVLGAYATKTNVSAAQFGEGSFDKGIYLSIPLDALLPRSSGTTLGFGWSPLTRDGGARLARSHSLYDMTSVRDPQAFRLGPPPDRTPRAGDNLINFSRGDGR